MPGILNLGRVDVVGIRLDYVSALGAPAHDVFLLGVHAQGADESFDETPYLEALAPVAGGVTPYQAVVHVNRTHHVGLATADEAEIVLVLVGGAEHTLAPAAVEVVRAAFRGILGASGDPPAVALDREEAIARSPAEGCGKLSRGGQRAALRHRRRVRAVRRYVVDRAVP